MTMFIKHNIGVVTDNKLTSLTQDTTHSLDQQLALPRETTLTSKNTTDE